MVKDYEVDRYLNGILNIEEPEVKHTRSITNYERFAKKNLLRKDYKSHFFYLKTSYYVIYNLIYFALLIISIMSENVALTCYLFATRILLALVYFINLIYIIDNFE